MRSILAAFRGLLRRTRAEQELDEELREYLDAAIEQKMSTGLNREEAARAARVELGSLEAVKDRVRDVGWESVLETCWQDVRYAIRTLRRSPGFAVVAVLTLALGIGANTAIFSVVNSLMLRTLPVAEPQRLVTVSSASASKEGYGLEPGWTYQVWDQIRRRADMFDGALAWSGVGPGSLQFNLAPRGEMEPVDGLFVSGDFFTTLGVPAVLGRTFRAADDVHGGGPDGPVAVVSYRLWQRRFGGAANVVGRRLLVDGVPFTIVGVIAPDFFGVEVGQAFDVAVPFGTEPLIHGKDTWLDINVVSVMVMLRLKPGQSLEAAEAALRGVQPQIREAAMPEGLPPRFQQYFLEDPFSLVPAATGTSRLRDQYAAPLGTVLVIAAFVLLIACANIANLMLARAAARQHELSVRLALGAPRWRLARQLFVESLVLAGIGATLGLVCATWASQALVAQLSTWDTHASLDVSLDWRVLVFTVAVTATAAVLFGTAPGFRAARLAPATTIRPTTGAFTPGGVAGGGPTGLSSGLVVAQLALSLVLVIAAGLFVRTFQQLATVPLGFDSDRVLVVNVDAARALMGDRADRIALYHRLVDAVAAVPGVAHAAASQNTPVNRGVTTMSFIAVPGGPPMSERERLAMINFVTPGWFATYGMPLRAGRDIDERDARRASPAVVVNDAFVRQFFARRNPVGETLDTAIGLPTRTPLTHTIIGVVGNAVDMTLHDDVRPTMYLPLAQRDLADPLTSISISVRSSTGSPVSLAPSVAKALTAVDGTLAFSFRPLEEQVNAARHQERLVALLSGFFGALALLLAALGLYGVTSYAVTRRRSEIGIRMALGARRADVIGLVLRKSLAMTAVGIVLGLAGATAVTRYLEAMLFGLTPLDPTTFIAVSLLFATVAAVAAFVPARRATTVDPLIALRSE